LTENFLGEENIKREKQQGHQNGLRDRELKTNKKDSYSY